jgi:hypothetical protein
VTALGSSPGLRVVAVEDGQIFLFERDSSWGLIYTWPGSVAATRAFWDGIDVVAQRTGRVERLSLKPRGSHGCSATRALGAREELAAASGGREVLARGSHFRVLPGCGGKAVATGMASAVALDGDRLTTASGRRITTRFLPQP